MPILQNVMYMHAVGNVLSRNRKSCDRCVTALNPASKNSLPLAIDEIHNGYHMLSVVFVSDCYIFQPNPNRKQTGLVQSMKYIQDAQGLTLTWSWVML